MYTTSAYVSSQEYTYDLRGNVICFTNDIGGRAYSQTYRYGKLTDENDNVINDSLRNGKEGLVTRYGALGTYTYYTYDGFNRRQLATVDLDTDIVIDYDYKISDRTDGTYYTTQISSENINGVRYNYTYDNMGNITAITKAGANYRAYVYDVLGQLITEKQFDNKQQTQYTYNHLGNITKKVVTTYTDSALNVVSSTVTYQYRYGNDNAEGWNYLLTSYDINGDGIVDESEKISYDEIGNPTTYMGAATSWNGRQLTAYSKGNVNATFTYDADGLRGSKTVNGVKTVYQYVGDKLYYEKRGDNQEFYYFYDGFGNLSTIYYTFGDSRAVYYVTTNMQGDVNAIYNSSGTLVARYEYDAWGNTLSVTDASGNPITAWYNIANANPIRYRGYYYDKDLDLYYLQSRYYDSNTGRFLNADKFVTTGQGVLSYNMFAYCLNNPVNYSDPTGNWREIIKKVFGFIKEVISALLIDIYTELQSFEICNNTIENDITTQSVYFDAGPYIGELGVSFSRTDSNKERGLFHSFNNTNEIWGTDEVICNSGIGVNALGICGKDIGFSSSGHLFYEKHLFGFVHASATFGIDGIGLSAGIDYEKDKSIDFTARAGWIIPALLVLATPNTEERQAFVPAPAY